MARSHLLTSRRYIPAVTAVVSIVRAMTNNPTTSTSIGEKHIGRMMTLVAMYINIHGIQAIQTHRNLKTPCVSDSWYPRHFTRY